MKVCNDFMYCMWCYWVMYDNYKLEDPQWFDSCSARFPSPTGDALRDLARPFQDGWSSGRFNHSFRIEVKHLSGSHWLASLIASSVPGERPNSNPRLYHLARPSHTAPWTLAKSSTVRVEPCFLTYVNNILFTRRPCMHAHHGIATSISTEILTFLSSCSRWGGETRASQVAVCGQ